MDLNNFATVFGLVFISELGDKTQLAVVGLSAKSSIRWPILVGAAAAFVLLSLLAAVIGALIGDAVPTQWVTLVAGLLFIGIGAITLRSAIRGEDDEGEGLDGTTENPANRTWLRASLSAFTLIFVAELGDKSQLAVATLAAETRDALAAFVGASLALILLALASVIGGAVLSRYIKPRLVDWIAGLLFVSIGVFLVVETLILGVQG